MRIALLHNDDFADLEGVRRLSQDSVLGVVDAVARAIRVRGHAVTILPARDVRSLLEALETERPDRVFNLCESLQGDARGEAFIPSLLERLGISCTGTSGFGLALALDKPKSKAVLAAAGIPTPWFASIAALGELARHSFPFPVIVKPSREDASIGIDADSVVADPAGLERACRRILDEYRQPALVESYIDGRELNVSLLGLEVLPIGEIDFSALPSGHPPIVTYAAKWEEESVAFRATPPIPCALPEASRSRIGAIARAAFDALECRDYGRVDLRLARDGTPYVIEVNPNCDLAPTAGFARAALAAGISYDAMVDRILALAGTRGSP